MPESLLRRIIVVSSNAGDCVLDPFSGSGTTAAVSFQLGRNYVGVEISEKYVENSNERLAQLKKQPSGSLFLDSAELDELKRLSADIKIPLREITADKKLLKQFTNQFVVRMNSQKRYSTEQIMTALKDLTD
jgi:tRNA G10  N-methylase Trm11